MEIEENVETQENSDTSLEDNSSLESTETTDETVEVTDESTEVTDESAEITDETVEGTDESTETTDESTIEIVTEDGTTETIDIQDLISTDVTTTQMSSSYIALSSIHLVISILLILVVLRQSKANSSISTLEGSQTYWSQNKGRSQESKLAKLTVILAVLFLIVTLFISFF